MKKNTNHKMYGAAMREAVQKARRARFAFLAVRAPKQTTGGEQP